ncbi:MAG: phosphatase PAP2 family protein, partial [Prevotellaceae bacterium]|nr:phosphatase PAP2 family protein [Prevotellaceae bacterium]
MCDGFETGFNMKYDLAKKLPTPIPNYSTRLLWFVTVFFVCNTIFAQTSDTSLFVGEIPAKASPKFKVADIAVPALMVTYGAVSLNNRTLKKWDSQIKTGLYRKHLLTHASFDDYLQFAPTVAVFGMKIAGVKSCNRLWDMITVCALSNLLETGIVHSLKNVSSRVRPDGSANNSFPSGHTAMAFAAAEFLRMEYGHKSVWFSIGGYTAATMVGVGRILNNRHWLSDVVAGAGIGILSTKIVYLAYPSLQKIFRKKNTGNLKPVFYSSYKNNAFCLNVVCD